MAKKAAATEAPEKTKKIKASGFAPLKFQEYTITQKRSGRFQVVDAKGKNINAAAKEKVLLSAKVLKGSFKKAGGEETPAT